MAANTKNLGLYMADPMADADNYFDIDKMLNENWEKIDSKLASPSTRYAKTFLASDWQAHADANGSLISDDKVIIIPASEHGLTAPIFSANFRSFIAPNCVDVSEDTLADVQTKIVNAFTAAMANPTAYPVQDNTINMGWFALQKYLLTAELVTEADAQAEALKRGYNWQDVETILGTSGNTLEELCRASYQKVAELNVIDFPVICTVATLNHLRFRIQMEGSRMPGFCCDFDLDGGLTASTWRTIGCNAYYLPRSKDIILRAPAAFSGDVQLVGS